MLKKILKRTAVVMISIVFFTTIFGLDSFSGRAASQGEANGIVICLDPGHQKYADTKLEPDGPNSSVLKPRVSAGATGIVTGKPEYALNLEVSLLLRDLLEEKGYTVIMTRESNDVHISNKERAEIANEAQADLFLRIHADGSEDKGTNGISVLYPSAHNPYTKNIYEASRTAAGSILDGMVERTGAASRGTVARDDLSGFNWSTVPTALVEMGFLSNPNEDKRMSEPEYQHKLAEGMLAGIEMYFRDNPIAGATIEPVEGTFTLLTEAKLYNRGGREFTASPYAVAPQQLKVFARMREWYGIHTWVGDLWVDSGKATLIRGEVTPADEAINLASNTAFYQVPLMAGEPLGLLAPQTIHAFEAWEGWLHIHTWLGDAWLHN